MRKTILALALALLVPLLGHTQVYETDVYTLAVNWDIDGEAADADQVVLSSNLVDSASFTITANPDVCRLVDVTITDANSSITAGVLTVVGTDCWGNALTTTYTFAAGGSGVKTLVVGTPAPPNSNMASGAYYLTVTSASVGVLTGEDVPGTDLITIGYTSNSQPGYSLYGLRRDLPIPPYRFIDPDGKREQRVQVKQGASSTQVTAVTASTNPFLNVVVNDLVGFTPRSGITMPVQWRKVTAKADDDNITVDFPIAISTTSQGFFYKKWFLSTDPQDGWIGVFNYSGVQLIWEETTNGTNTGGIVSNMEVAYKTTSPILHPSNFSLATQTVASGSTGVGSAGQQLALFEFARLGLKFGTGDDTDATAAATEGVYAAIAVRR